MNLDAVLEYLRVKNEKNKKISLIHFLAFRSKDFASLSSGEIAFFFELFSQLFACVNERSKAN